MEPFAVGVGEVVVSAAPAFEGGDGGRPDSEVTGGRGECVFLDWRRGRRSAMSGMVTVLARQRNTSRAMARFNSRMISFFVYQSQGRLHSPFSSE